MGVRVNSIQVVHDIRMHELSRLSSPTELSHKTERYKSMPEESY